MEWPRLKDFSFLDWMIHFGVFMNLLITFAILWHVFTR